MIKLDLVQHVINRTGLPKIKAERAVDAVFEAIKRGLAHSERVEFRGFGIFEIRPRRTGIGRDPRSGLAVPIQPGKAIRFRPGKGLQELE